MEPDAAMEDDTFTDEQIASEIERFRSIVLSACSSLGNLEPVTTPAPGSDGPAVHRVSGTNMQYVPSDDCLASLKDIKRYIQMDEQGEGKFVLQWLGEWEVLQRDIIPIFTLSVKRLLADAPAQRLDDHDRDHVLKVVMMCVELFVFLTWDMDPEHDAVKTRFIPILRAYKRAFAANEVVASLLSVAVMYVRKSHNTDREALLVKGVIYVFRNTLAIPDPLVSATSRGLARVESHDTLIAALDKELAVDFFLTLMSSADQRRFKDLRPLLLDIIYYIYYRVPVSALFATPAAWFAKDGPQCPSRHTMFSGVYAVSTGAGTIMPVFNVRDVLRPFANLFKKDLKSNRRKKPRTRDDGPVSRQWRTVDPDALPVLRRIAAVFIESCFNPFIGVLLEDLRGAPTVVDTTTPRLLYVAGYFVDISLANPAIDLGCICGVAQKHAFSQIVGLASTYVELKEWHALESAMYCIRQILLALSRMHGTKLDALSTNVLSNLFYDGEALDLFIKMCRVYRPTLVGRRFMEQVAQLTDTFLATLKGHADSREGLYIAKRVKRRKSKKRAGADAAEAEPEPDSADPPPGSDVQPSSTGEDEEEAEVAGADMEADADSGNDSNDDDDSNVVQVERAFDFVRFESAFAVAEVAKAFTHLLVPPASMEYVYPMLRRIAITCQKPHLFFKRATMLRLLVLFDDSLSFPNQAETIDVAAWIFRQYMTVIDSPALCKHFNPEPLKEALADKCMRSFLATSTAGTSVEPVITRHIIDLLAGDGSTGAAAGGDSADPHVTGSIALDSAPVDNTVDDFDQDDFDLDKYFALGNDHPDGADF
ncbi:Topoisomerase 1-associated factor 1 [Coemansia spiralis]|nr:Topoisomerase 1-associated factor 1 [Coemansia spiralis]